MENQTDLFYAYSLNPSITSLLHITHYAINKKYHEPGLWRNTH